MEEPRELRLTPPDVSNKVAVLTVNTLRYVDDERVKFNNSLIDALLANDIAHVYFAAMFSEIGADLRAHLQGNGFAVSTVTPALINELFQSGDSVFFFDSEEKSILAVEAAIHARNDFGQEHIKISTCLVPENFDEAWSNGQRVKYDACLQGHSSGLVKASQPKICDTLETIFPEEIKAEDWDKVATQHCGQSFTIATDGGNEIHLTTLDVQMIEPLSFNADESEASLYERLSRITHLLKRDIALNHTAIIVLQDVPYNIFLVNKEGNGSIALQTDNALRERMPPGWEVIKGEDQLVTLYNPAVVTMEKTCYPAANSRDIYLITNFTVIADNSLIDVVNVQCPSRDNTTKAITATERYIEAFVDKSHSATTVVVGSLNLLIPSLVYATDNRTTISSSMAKRGCTEGCFVHNPQVHGGFIQLHPNTIFSGYLDSHGRAQVVKRVPMLLSKINSIPTSALSSGVPMLFPGQRRLFPMGPTENDYRTSHGDSKFELRIDPFFTLRTCIASLDTDKIWHCNTPAEQIQFMELPFAHPTPLKIFFDAIHTLPAAQRQPLQLAALELVASQQQFIHQCQHVYDKDAIEASKQAFAAVRAKLRHIPVSFAERAMQALATFLEASMATALITAVVGTVAGAIAGACVGNLTLPVLGCLPGALAGAITGFIIGTGGGFVLAGAAVGLQNAAYRCLHKQSIFHQKPQDPLETFTTACALPELKSPG